MNGYHNKPNNSLVLIVDGASGQLDDCKVLLRPYGYLSMELVHLTDIERKVRDVSIPLAIIFDPDNEVTIAADIDKFRRKHPETKIIYLGDVIKKEVEAQIRELGVIFMGSHRSFMSNSQKIIEKALQVRSGS